MPRASRVGAVLDDGRVVDLVAAGVAAAADMIGLIEAGPAALAAAKQAAASPPAGAVLAKGAARIEAPIPRPRRNVFCVGRNYMDHVAEGDRTRGITNSELPKFPQFFTKAPEAVIARRRADPRPYRRDRTGSTTRSSWSPSSARKARTSRRRRRWSTSSAGPSATT